MKPIRLLLDTECCSSITIGLIRMEEEVLDHRFFFTLNKLNSFNFSRIDDFVWSKNNALYHFSRFVAFDKCFQTHFIAWANHSCFYEKKQIFTELFDSIEEDYYLLPNLRNVKFIVTSREENIDFSCIALPNEWKCKMENYFLEKEEPFYYHVLYEEVNVNQIKKI